jgi:hypothetical protein
MFSMITDIYNNKTKELTLMELITATGKLKKFFFWQLEMFDVCITGDTAHINTILKFWPHTRRITAAVKNIDAPTLTRVWQELEYLIDVCRVNRGARIEHLPLPKKNFQFSCGCEQFIKIGPLVGRSHPFYRPRRPYGEQGIALLCFLDLSTRRDWEVSVTPRPLSTPGKHPVPIVQEAEWAPGPIWTGAEYLTPTGIRFPDRPARSQSLYRLSYRAHLGPLVFLL